MKEYKIIAGDSIAISDDEEIETGISFYDMKYITVNESIKECSINLFEKYNLNLSLFKKIT
jgi:hypothetical protein